MQTSWKYQLHDDKSWAAIPRVHGLEPADLGQLLTFLLEQKRKMHIKLIELLNM